MLIDTTFDFRSDAGGGDPDSTSPTLRRYHRLLWSKPLPGGAMFDLVDTTPFSYLHHKSEVGEFWLASDAVIATFQSSRAASAVIDQLPAAELEEFQRVGYRIGGMMVFPGDRREGKMTINGARGFHPRIADRFDLTLECIRRHYRGEESPLGTALTRYGDFFARFHDFRGYVEFFLLQDLVAVDYSVVRFFTPFAEFRSRPVPTDLDDYLEFKRSSLMFVEARNRRIAAWAAERLSPTKAGE